MQKIKTEEQSADVTVSESSKNIATSARGGSDRRSRESLWGAILFACMLMFVIVSVGGVGWVVYSQWKSERIAESQPSISTLSASDEETPPTIEEGTVPVAEATASANDDTTATAQNLTISVLNGGGAKGSAGTLAEFLKTAGYSKTQAGNTIKNYTGVTVYYTANLEKEAESIKGTVAKKYPQVTISPADTKNNETSASQITIIIGK